MIQFIEKDAFNLEDSILKFIKSHQGLREAHNAHLNAKLARARQLLEAELPTNGDDPIETLLNINVARQKVRAIKEALQQLNGEL